MGDLWRSQKMQLVQMIVQNDAAHGIFDKLGNLGLVELRDMNAGTSFYKRSFTEEVRRCEEISRVLRNIAEELEAASVKPGVDVDESRLPSLDVVEPKVREAEAEVAALKETQDLLKKNTNALVEQKLVLEKGKLLYTAKAGKAGEATAELSGVGLELMSLAEFGGASSSMLGLVAGVIKSELVASLERVIFRATRGNAVFESVTIDEPLLDTDTKSGHGEMCQKTFFMVFFAGDVLKDKVSKICTYFGAALYHYPDTASLVADMSKEVDKRLAESQEVLAAGEAVLAGTLRTIGGVYATWNYVVEKEKMIFDALNMCEFDIKRHVFVAEGWTPVKQYATVVDALMDAAAEIGSPTRPIINKLESRLTPPTFIPTNKLTNGFQVLVNTYGTPRYREANPGAFCCIFFPFLFGIMFGDFGHGMMLAMFGYWLITKEKEWEGKQLNDMVQMCYGGRYVILLNGLFGAYVGLLYNEAFAFPMNFFAGSRWRDTAGGPCDPKAASCAMIGQYPVGIDPIWHYTTNKITFFNSFKMKISIVVGVIQMSVGIFLSLLNHIEYRDWKKVWFQFVPEVMFFECIFGYLVFTIFAKWATDWSCGPGGLCQPAPSLLTLLINMFMSPTSPIDVPLYAHQCFTDCKAAKGFCAVGSIAKACPVTCGSGLGSADLLKAAAGAVGETKVCFSQTQSKIQLYLVLTAVVGVPLLLFPIPFIEAYQHSKSKSYEELDDAHDEGEGGGGGGHDDGHGEFSMGDAFIHQGIHTIEFVLGGISNTASYLRLWALSLAHSQLAELFKDMILIGFGVNANKALGVGTPLHMVMLFLMTGMWAIISFVVLMVMENLSSFLHALRLQWVEFQSKFFYGDGTKYTPFSFATLKEAAGED